MAITPAEDDLTQELVALKEKHPQLGITKVHAQVLKNHPDWVVSEKRTRKILQSLGLIVAGPTGTVEQHVYPSSRIIENLDVKHWSNKVGVKYFDKKKGKGLVATKSIGEDEIIWREDPFVIAAEWEIFDLQQSSAACGFCTTPLVPDSPLINACPASSSSSFCPIRFCNRLCLARSAKVHPLLCPVQNPGSVPLIKFAKEMQWMSLHALAQCTSRLLQSYQLGDAAFNSDWNIVKSMAELGMEERFRYSFRTPSAPEPDRSMWKKGYNLYLEAFNQPTSIADQKKLTKLLKRTLPEDISDGFFMYDSYLRNLGRMSLNIEAHGGLYVLHAHLNHSCDPNVSVRHLDTRNALSRITVLPLRPIKKGEELLVTYVNPKLGWRARQDELRGWGFGACTCSRCVEEEKMVNQPAAVNDELDDLASELKAGLGVM